jgi:hypothetical protein
MHTQISVFCPVASTIGMKPSAIKLPVSTLLLRLARAMIIAVALGLCLFKQAVHGTKKLAAFIGITGAVDHPTKGPPSRYRTR